MQFTLSCGCGKEGIVCATFSFEIYTPDQIMARVLPRSPPPPAAATGQRATIQLGAASDLGK